MVGTDETIHQLRGISRELARNMVQIPTPEEIAERTELSIEKVRRVIEVARRRKAISLGTAFGEGDSELVDLVTDEDTACPEDEFVQRRVVEQTRRLLATLTPREEEILRKCFGIGGDDYLQKVLDQLRGPSLIGVDYILHTLPFENLPQYLGLNPE